MSNDPAPSPDSVFINCPFDLGYAPIFDALIFAVYACGFRPRSARELDDGGQTRIDKIYGIIADCRYGIHDLSRTELDPVNSLPRFNMPLELGIFLGARRFGGRVQAQKRCLVLDVEQYRYQKFISDLAGMDIEEHDGKPRRAVAAVRNWLANASRRKIDGPARIVAAYDQFSADLPALAAALGFGGQRPPYVDYERIVTGWLIAAPPAGG